MSSAKMLSPLKMLDKTLREAWTQQQVTYRTCAHSEPITPANLGQA